MRRSTFKQATFKVATFSCCILFLFIGLLASACSPQLRYPDLPQTGFTHTPKVTLDETQDLQGWVSGSRVNVSPFKVEAVFAEPHEDIMPSDHNGLLVHYRLSWPVSENIKGSAK